MYVNGLARGYMAKNQKEKTFLKHVLRCIEQSLTEAGNSVGLRSYERGNHFVITLVMLDNVLTFKMSKTEVRWHQDSSLYALDCYIWEQIKAQPLEINYEDPYLKSIGITPEDKKG